MFQKKCEDRILDLIEHHNTTVLIVSHSNEQVARLCNKAIWIEKGKTRMIGEAEKVCEIYGLVGGRLGSLKAESEIIAMSEKMPNEDCSDIAFYSEGATYGDIALNLAKHACQKDIETICVCSNLTHVGCAVANSIAGAYNAPLLSIDHSTIDHFVLDWIEDVKPKRLIIVDHGHATSCATLASHKFDFDLEIINITGELNCANFSLLAYNKLLERGVNLNEPIVAYLENSLALDLLLARESYENVRPIIVLEGTNLENPSNVIDWLKVNNFKAVSILNDETLAPVVKTLEDNNISCEMLFNDEDELDFMSMAEQLSVNKEYQEAVVSPYVLGNFASATSAGYYCTKKNACCIIVDDTSLDSIAKGIKFISDHKIKKLSFIQGAGALSDATSTLLSRIAKYNSLQQ